MCKISCSNPLNSPPESGSPSFQTRLSSRSPPKRPPPPTPWAGRSFFQRTSMSSDLEIIERRRNEPWWLRTLRETAVHDFGVFAFLLSLNLAVLCTPSTAERTFCLVRTGALLSAFTLSLLLVRGRLIKIPWIAALVYRIGIYGVVQVSYFSLRHVLPLVNTTTLDQKLYDFDLSLFNYERAMADAFQHPFPSGTWYNLVMDTVHSGGAMMDIFPSLHTGAPTVLALFSFRNRDKLPYRYTWPLVAFCTVNIIIATMFLRWHYMIDVIAGFTIAVTTVLVSRPITRWEIARRKREGLGELWPEYSSPPMTGSKDLADG